MSEVRRVRRPWYVAAAGIYLIVFAAFGAIGVSTDSGASFTYKLVNLLVTAVLVLVAIGLVATRSWAWSAGIFVAVIGTSLGAWPFVVGDHASLVRVVALGAYLLPGVILLLILMVPASRRAFAHGND